MTLNHSILRKKFFFLKTLKYYKKAPIYITTEANKVFAKQVISDDREDVK